MKGRNLVLLFGTLVILLVPSTLTLADPDNDSKESLPEPDDEIIFPDDETTDPLVDSNDEVADSSLDDESTSSISGSTSGKSTPSIEDPPGLAEGDIVLLRWNNPQGLLRTVYWSHAMLCHDNNKNNPKFYHAWNGVEDSTWSEIIDRSHQHDRRGLANRAVVRLNGYSSSYIEGAIDFASDRYTDGVRHYYDFWSQKFNHKQVQPVPSSWWRYVLPPQNHHYHGPSDHQSWIDAFSYNDRQWYWYDGSWHDQYPAQDYYCTEFVWAAYFQGSEGDIYWEHTADIEAISGMEILYDSDLNLFKNIYYPSDVRWLSGDKFAD